jgi:ribosomal protein S18 acetylase RimI-like enzyme
MPLIIRSFQSQDEPEVAALWTQVFGYPDARNEPSTAIRQKMAFQPELFFVAVLDDWPVGTVMAGYDGHRGWIYSLAVAEDRRAQGIGSALVLHAEDALRALSCSKINLQVRADNEAVVAFYRKLGYAVEPRISMGKVL